MPRTYDKWERLVAAVLKREEFRRLCQADSSESSISSSISSEVQESDPQVECELTQGIYITLVSHSISSISSDLNTCSTSQFDENLKSWIEPYEPGVYISIEDLDDGTRNIKRVRFSKKRFDEHQAKAWWLQNREKIYLIYNCQAGLIHSRLSSDFNPSSTSPSDENLQSAKSEVQESGRQIKNEWIENYEPGIYITLFDRGDGTRDIKRVRFSRKRFNEHQANAWWLKNREKICQIYNCLALLIHIRLSSDFNPSSTSPFDENLTSAKSEVQKSGGQIKNEWLVPYEPGVYITLLDCGDGTRDLKRVQFSRRFFGELQAEAWWSKNRERVYEIYNIQMWLNRMRQRSVSCKTPTDLKVDT